jgi:hypothetical protein
MSLVAVALNLLLAGLLIAALGFGVVLNRRLMALKESHANFAAAVDHLDRAAQRAEHGLAELRTATDQAVDLLSSRIMKARALAESLDRLTIEGAALLERRIERAPSSPRAVADRIAADRGQASSAAADRAAQSGKGRFPLTTEEEALAAAETLILRLSRTEALTSGDMPPREAIAPERLAPRPEPRLAARHRPEPRAQARAAAPEPRPEPRVNPRSRAQIDDDLFEPPARGRLRAFDGGLA